MPWGYVLLSVGTVLDLLANANPVDRLDRNTGELEASVEFGSMLLPFLIGGWEAITDPRQAREDRSSPLSPTD